MKLLIKASLKTLLLASRGAYCDTSPGQISRFFFKYILFHYIFAVVVSAGSGIIEKQNFSIFQPLALFFSRVYVEMYLFSHVTGASEMRAK